MVPFGRNRTFVGRQMILDELLKHLPPAAQPDDCQRMAIQGLGGVGKTQIALEAIYRIRDEHPACSVFWVSAINASFLDRSYRDIALALGLKGIDDNKSDIANLVHARLAQDDMGPWIWVIDNLDDERMLKREQGSLKLPFSRNGSILITTRNKRIAVQADITPSCLINVSAMERNDSIKLLDHSCDNQKSTMASVNTLLDYLADLPLAIKQASAYMKKNSMTIQKYLGYCQSGDDTLMRLLSKDFDDRGRYEAAQNPVAMTWLISFKQISQEAPLAVEFLRFISFLSDKNISPSLLPESNSLDAEEAIGILKAYAFVNEHAETSFLDMHRLVQLAVRNWMTHEGSLTSWANVVTGRLTEVYPTPSDDNREDWTRHLPHLQTAFELSAQIDQRIRISLLSKLGQSAYCLGRYKDAEIYHEHLFKINTDDLGPEHPVTLKSEQELALVFYGQGDIQRAGPMFHKIYKLRNETLGPRHPDTLTSSYHLGLFLRFQGNYAQAEELYSNNYELRKEVLGDEHQDTVESLYELANTVFRRGKCAEAEKILIQTLSLFQKILGSHHKTTLTNMNDLAYICGERGRFTEAERLHCHTLALRREVLGGDDRDTLESMNNLARTLLDQGRFSDAELLCRQTIELYCNTLGTDHPDTCYPKTNLAQALYKQGVYTEAESVLRETLEVRHRIYGDKHPIYLMSIDRLAELRSAQHQYPEAKALHRHTLDLRREILGAKHPRTLLSAYNLAVTLSEMHEPTEAERLHRETFQLRCEVLGADHPHTKSSAAQIYQYRTS